MWCDWSNSAHVAAPRVLLVAPVRELGGRPRDRRTGRSANCARGRPDRSRAVWSRPAKLWALIIASNSSSRPTRISADGNCASRLAEELPTCQDTVPIGGIGALGSRVPMPSPGPRVLWTPPPDVRETTEIGRYLDLARARARPRLRRLRRAAALVGRRTCRRSGRRSGSSSRCKAHAPYSTVLASDAMPGARWFPGARLNFAEHLLGDDEDARADGDRLPLADARAGRAHVRASSASRSPARAPVCCGSASGRATASWPTCRTSPRRSSRSLATASLGAVWASCAPELGARSVIDRLGAARAHRPARRRRLRLPRPLDRPPRTRWPRSARRCPRCGTSCTCPTASTSCRTRSAWEELLAEPGRHSRSSRSRSTTRSSCCSRRGRPADPKAIVHGHGGILLELPQGARVQLGPEARRPAALVHDDLVDDVERARRGAARALVDRDARRRPDLARPAAGSGGSPRRRGRRSWASARRS